MSFLEIAGKRFEVTAGETVVGSGTACPVRLEGADVAAAHAVLQTTSEGQLAIRKADDSLVILINGVRLGPQPTPLLHGDKVQIGQHELLFVDERRSGSTQYVEAMDAGTLAALAINKKHGGQPTAATGGRLVSLTDGREYTIAGLSLVLGREAGCDVVVTSRNVSRRHAEIMATQKGYVLVDHSTNGTLVNGQKVEGQQILARADVIRVGDDDFRFYADKASPASPASPASTGPPAPPSAPSATPSAPPVASPAPGPEAPQRAPEPALPPIGAEHKLSNTMHGVPTVPRGRRTQEDPVSPRTGEEVVRESTAHAESAAAQPLALISVRTGSAQGQKLAVTVPIANIGRAEYNDVVIPDDSVSTMHAKLQRRESVWIVVDLDSTNGTFVDGERVAGEAVLAPGAILRFGEVKTFFEPTDDSVDVARGSSTKLMGAFKAPPKPETPAAPPPGKPPEPAPGPETPGKAGASRSGWKIWPFKS